MNLDSAFLALADPTRRAILARLAQGEATVGELAAPLPISQPAVSRHLRVLQDAGLILRRVDAQRRPCRLNPDALPALEAWLAQLRRGLDARHARLDALLAATDPQRTDPERTPDAPPSHDP